MAEDNLYAVYASKDIAPAQDDYWEARRELAAKLRELQLAVQTHTLSSEQLKAINAGIAPLIAKAKDAKECKGRTEWCAEERYGTWGTIQTETTAFIGPASPMWPGLSIWFENSDDGMSAHAIVNFNWLYEGAHDIVHGGWVAAVFDEFLGTAQILSGKTGMTVSLKTSYHKPTPIGTELLMQAEVVSVKGNKVVMRGEMRAGDVLTASCEGVFIIPKKAISEAFQEH